MGYSTPLPYRYVTVKIKSREAKLEAQNNIAEVRIRYERELGALIQRLQANGELYQSGGNRGNQYLPKSPDATLALTLSDVGITRDQSSNWQAVSIAPGLTPPKAKTIAQVDTYDESLLTARPRL